MRLAKYLSSLCLVLGALALLAATVNQGFIDFHRLPDNPLARFGVPSLLFGLAGEGVLAIHSWLYPAPASRAARSSSASGAGSSFDPVSRHRKSGGVLGTLGAMEAWALADDHPSEGPLVNVNGMPMAPGLLVDVVGNVFGAGEAALGQSDSLGRGPDTHDQGTTFHDHGFGGAFSDDGFGGGGSFGGSSTF